MRERAARRLLGVLGGVVLAASACGTTALTSSNGAATEPNAPRWQSEGEVDTVGSASWATVPYPASIQQGPDGNLRPLWILYRVSATGGTEQVTPKGISTRGGLAVSATSPSQAWALVGSYRMELDGAVALTTDGGKHWSQQIVPAEVDPTPDGIAAFDSSSAVVIAGTGHDQFLLETTDGGADWRRLAGAKALLASRAKGCELSGVAAGANGALWIGTSCQGGGAGLVLRRGVSGQIQRWSLGSVPSGDWVDIVPAAGPDGVVLSMSWGRSAHSAEGAELFIPPKHGAPSPLGGPVSTGLGTSARVRLLGGSPGSSPFALVVQRPASWLDQGQSELLAGGSAWTRPSASAPPGAAHADVLGSFPGAGPGTLLVGGSTKAGKPALWRVTFSSGALSWSPLRLVVPKTATASNLEGAGS